MINQFIHDKTDADAFHEMVACCYEAWNIKRSNADAARLAISLFEAWCQKRTNEQLTLYNNKRNISFNQCIGESRTPVSEWFNPNNWSEWD